MDSITPILLEAIALRKCVTVTYNKVEMKLAPHILYTRHGELYVDAVALEKAGQPAREIKIGTFKLTGLSHVALAEQMFEPQEIFEPEAEKYAGVTLFAIEA